MITDVPGVCVGHWTDARALTGCTAVVLPPGTRAAGEIRGGAPAAREGGVLAPERTVATVDVIILCGGSAYGLAACDGAMRWCEERGRGVATPAGSVPIVVGFALFDLGTGDGQVRPGAEEGYAACTAAADGPFETGRVGAGTGATINKHRGPEHALFGGLGSTTLAHEGLVVSALVAVNAVGQVLERGERAHLDPAVPPAALENTTLAVVATNAELSKLDCLVVSQSMHDGFARAIEPVHTAVDGDAAVCAATGEVSAPREFVRALAARAVEDAIRVAVAPRAA
jgi:L-aminopeptidase/D-esterase-like protein